MSVEVERVDWSILSLERIFALMPLHDHSAVSHTVSYFWTRHNRLNDCRWCC